MVVPANELGHAMTGLPFGGEDLVIRPVFDYAEQQFPVQVVLLNRGRQKDQVRPVASSGSPAWPHSSRAADIGVRD